MKLHATVTDAPDGSETVVAIVDDEGLTVADARFVGRGPEDLGRTQALILVFLGAYLRPSDRVESFGPDGDERWTLASFWQVDPKAGAVADLALDSSDLRRRKSARRGS